MSMPERTGVLLGRLRDGDDQAVGELFELYRERLWRMPLYAAYRVLLRSRIADLKNGYYGEANAITAAMFVSHFAEGRPWAHLDIAASSWNSNPELVTIPRGPLGAGTRLAVHLTELLAGTDRLG